jgi:hypothetical protein
MLSHWRKMNAAMISTVTAPTPPLRSMLLS